MNPQDWREKVVLAYIEEPPFARTADDGTPTGCDVIVGLNVLKSLGIKQIETRLVTFPELIPGLVDQQWTLNVPIFITADRGKLIRYSRPVWALSDGFLVRTGMFSTLNSYEAVAHDDAARLGVVKGQVQHQTALDAGIPADRIRIFETQDEVIAALLDEQVDLFTCTAMGHRAYIQQQEDDRLAVIDLIGPNGEPIKPELGAYSFAKPNTEFANAFDQALERYIGSAEHRKIMIEHGFTDDEIDRLMTKN